MGVFVLVLGVAALVAVLLSSVSSRSPLSTTGIFLVIGLAAGPLGLDLVSFDPESVEHAAEIALFVILFVDGQHAPWAVVRRHIGTASRALLLAMPLTFAIVAVAGHYVVGLDWPVAMVLGAVLAPTDPVFAAALVGRDDVPEGTRSLLNLESGLNDGLALVAVLGLVGYAGGEVDRWSTDVLVLSAEAVLGAVVGLAVPLVILLLLRIPGTGAVPALEPMGPVAVALVLYGTCDLLDLNQFLAAFVGGATLATVRPSASRAFGDLDELVSELVKGGALLAFATLVKPETFLGLGLLALVVALITILVARPLPIAVVLLGSRLQRRERLAVGWFGPKGFASVAYGVIVASSTLPDADKILAVVTVVVLVSVVAHSSTDVAVAGWLHSVLPADDPAEPTGPERPGSHGAVDEEEVPARHPTPHGAKPDGEGPQP